MRKCSKCGNAYDDSWKVCLDCRVELKEAVDLTPDETKQVIETIGKIDDVIADSIGSVKLGLAGGQQFIEKTQDLCKEIMDEISNEFKRGDIEVVHLHYMLQLAITELLNISGMIMVEMQHENNHKEGCRIILNTIGPAHNMIDTKENVVEGLSKSRSRKVRSVANKVGHCFDEYHKALYITERSINNALKWEEKNK